MLLLTESEAAKNAFDLVSSVSGEVAGLMSFLKIFGGRGGGGPLGLCKPLFPSVPE